MAYIVFADNLQGYPNTQPHMNDIIFCMCDQAVQADSSAFMFCNTSLMAADPAVVCADIQQELQRLGLLEQQFPL